MNEGVYRILCALGDGRCLRRVDLARQAGEALSVVRWLLKDKPQWFECDEQTIRCSQAGLAALAREMIARRAHLSLSEHDAQVLRRLVALAPRRGRIKREIDQVRAMLPTVIARARRLVRVGEVQRGLVFLGDADLTSLAVHVMGVARRTTVIDIDRDVLDLLEAEAKANGWEHRGICHDLRRPLPRKLRGRFGCAFSDPPYAPEGFALFVSRAIELLRPDGRLYLCVGQSRRSSERGIKTQEILASAGVLVEEVIPDFNVYEGAASIGSRSALWVGVLTPSARPVLSGQIPDQIYTRRPPARRSRHGR